MTKSSLKLFFARSENQPLLITLVFFLSNQILEAIFIFAFQYPYLALCNWDCTWYVGIVKQGYDAAPHLFAHFPKGDVANWAFFPFLPISAYAIENIFGIFNSAYAIVLTSKLFFVLAIFSFIRFGLAYYPKLNPWILGFVASLHPYVIYGNAGYTESAFLLFTCLFFYYFKHGRFLMAGILGGILSAVRLAGIFALIAVFPKVVTQLKERTIYSSKPLLLMILLMPLGLSLFMTYLYLISGDALAFMHIQKAWGRQIQFPGLVLYQGLTGAPHYVYWSLLSIFSFGIAIFFMLQKKSELGIFLAANTIVPLATGLASMPRYLFWQAPFLLFLALLLARNPMYWKLVTPFAIFGIGVLYYFWPTGSNWVI